MHTPQHNPDGYASSAISNTTALSSTTRFLIMHGTSDDNVHFQNSLALLDKLDLDAVNNYDVHVFPDSDHGIYFHGAYAAVHQREFFSFSFVLRSLSKMFCDGANWDV